MNLTLITLLCAGTVSAGAIATTGNGTCAKSTRPTTVIVQSQPAVAIVVRPDGSRQTLECVAVTSCDPKKNCVAPVQVVTGGEGAPTICGTVAGTPTVVQVAGQALGTSRTLSTNLADVSKLVEVGPLTLATLESTTDLDGLVSKLRALGDADGRPLVARTDSEHGESADDESDDAESEEMDFKWVDESQLTDELRAKIVEAVQSAHFASPSPFGGWSTAVQQAHAQARLSDDKARALYTKAMREHQKSAAFALKESRDARSSAEREAEIAARHAREIDRARQGANGWRAFARTARPGQEDGNDLPARVAALEEMARERGFNASDDDDEASLEDRVAELERFMRGNVPQSAKTHNLLAPRVLRVSPKVESPRTFEFRGNARAPGQSRGPARSGAGNGLRRGRTAPPAPGAPAQTEFEGTTPTAPLPAEPPTPPPARKRAQAWKQADAPDGNALLAPRAEERASIERAMSALRAEADKLRAEMSKMRAEIERLPRDEQR